MNTTNLQYLLDHGQWLNQLHGQVCSRDLLPQLKPSDVRAYIVNTDKSDQPGEHWIAIYFYNDKKAFYFDSYGIPPLHNDITTFLERNSSA